MEDFLSTTVENLKSNNYATLNIVMGNESCDLDSAIACLVYACFLHWQHQQLKCKVCTKTNRVDCKDEIFVAILNVDREDYELKTEVEFFLTENKIYKDLLVFRNDYDLHELVAKTKTNLVLVDHHVLAKKDKFLVPYVTEIIDHRPIDKTEWNYKDDTRSTIEIVGSCCTLVTQRIKDLATLMSKELVFFNSYPICTQLLHSSPLAIYVKQDTAGVAAGGGNPPSLIPHFIIALSNGVVHMLYVYVGIPFVSLQHGATIILDTVNFSKEVDKATPHDLDMVLFLESILKPDNLEIEREQKLTRLLEARTNVSKLTAAQLLKKDVKIVQDIYVPSFPILVEEFLSKPGALSAVTEALSNSGCSLALLLGMSLQNELKRDTAICGNNAERTAKLAKYLEEWSRPSLQLTKTVAEYQDCFYYKQLNLSASRKQYMPALNDFLKETK